MTSPESYDFQEYYPTHRLTMSILMTREHANLSGKVHGGSLLKILDQVAYACAARYAGQYAVTLSVDQVIFRQPIHIGELVTFLASVNYTGNTSMEIGIKVIAENLKEKSVRHVNSCFFTMVAVDDEGRPTPVQPFKPTTPEEKKRYKAAQLRRKLRQEFEQKSHQILTQEDSSIKPE